MNLELEAKRVTIRLDFIGKRVVCPGCGEACSKADHAPERTWRHLDTMQFETVLAARVPRAGQHAAKFFFQRDDRGEYLCPGLQETSPQSVAKWSGIGQFLEVIGIEQEHGRVSLSRSAAMLRRVGLLRVQRRRLAKCRRW